MKKPGITDIAKKLRVSPASVSLALNNRIGVGEDLRNKVRELALEIGYIKKSDSKQTNLIGTIHPFIGGHIISKLDHAITTVLNKHGFSEIRQNLNVYDYMKNLANDKYFENVTNFYNVEGLIIAFLNAPDVVVNRLIRNHVPMVLLNSYSSYGPSVMIDDELGGYIATKKLLELGREKIGMVMPDIWFDTVWNQRRKGYKKALEESGIAFDIDLLETENTFYPDNVRTATLKLIYRHPEISALIFSGDQQAFFGMDSLQKIGKRVPQDISIIGFDNMDFCDVSKPTLTSVSMPFEEMGRVGAEILMESIHSGAIKNESIKLHPELIIRDSISSA